MNATGIYLQDLDDDNLADAPNIPAGWLGLVDEAAGGIVGYLSPDLAPLVVELLWAEVPV